jgi:hypothetical protein
MLNKFFNTKKSGVMAGLFLPSGEINMETIEQACL